MAKPKGKNRLVQTADVSTGTVGPGGVPGQDATDEANDFVLAQDQRRIRDVEQARAIYNKFVQDNTLRSSTIAQTRNQLEGGLPWDPKILEEQGAAWQTNVNFGDAQANRDRTLLPYWRMVHDVPRKIAVTVESDSPQSDRWQSALEEAFDDFIDDWGADYFCQFMNMASNFVNFGSGVVQWTDPDSARFSAVNTQRIYFPKNARMSPDEWDVVAMVRDMSPAELYLKVKDEKARKASAAVGWNTEAIQQAIVQGMYGTGIRDPRDYTRYQDDLVQNDITIQSTFQPLQIVWLYVRQFSGKIGCYAFTVMGGIQDFLYENDNEAENFRHLLGAVWYDTGVDSMIHSIKGFAIKNFHYAAMINRMKSRMVDGATMAFGINFQRQEDINIDEVPPVENFGPYSIFPKGIQQLGVYPQLQQGMAIVQQLENNRAENNSLYRQQQQTQIAESDTATQANILSAMQGELTEATSAIYLSQMGENIFAECFRKLRIKGNTDRDAKRFVKRLRARGVPDEIIFQSGNDKIDVNILVRTGANAGMASSAIRLQKYQQLLPLMNAPGMNSRWILEQYITNLFGSQSIGKAMIPEGTESNPQQRREAMIENSLFGQGMQLPVAPSDAHYEHVQEHLKPLVQMIQAYRQNDQLAPDQLSAMILTLQHTAGHIQYLKADKTEAAHLKEVLPVYSEVSSIAHGIATQAEKDAQAQQEAQVAQGGGFDPSALPNPASGQGMAAPEPAMAMAQ